MDECCLCGSSMDMRTMYRTRHNIRVSSFHLAYTLTVIGCSRSVILSHETF
jgi:hypothetical protein